MAPNGMENWPLGAISAATDDQSSVKALSTLPPTADGDEDDGNDTGSGSVTPSTTTITVVSAVGDPVIATPSQGFTRPLTTIYTPPPSCVGRFYISDITMGIDSRGGITSDFTDRLFRSCQPQVSAYRNVYSPGVCPSGMEIVAVSSSSLTGVIESGELSTPETTPLLITTKTITVTVALPTDDGSGDVTATPGAVIYTDICCQSGFLWDFTRCYSAVTTPTSVLLAPYVFSKDVRVEVSEVGAWHDPIRAIWQTADISLFPPDVQRTKRSIAESGFVASPTASVMPVPTPTTTPTPIDTSPTTQSPSRVSRLSTGAIIGIAFAAILSVCISITAACLYRRRRRRERGRADSLSRGCIGSPKGWMKKGQRAELSSVPATSHVPRSELGQLEQMGLHRVNEVPAETKAPPVELDSEPAHSPRFSYEFQGHESIEESIGSPGTDRIASFKPVSNQHPEHGLLAK
ncbi:hypothetical protein F5Y17DRAFT_264895 [Xylariaceae sp. FL0594]|nr:hypothetical protein F5Y17DRAFT_264895 [Xylariaceae sp. FL0594]